MGTLSKLRRLVLRDKVSIRQASRQLGISRNTATRWLQEPEMVEPIYPTRQPHTAKLLLRDLVNASIGFEQFARDMDKPSKSLHRMLSATGNPTLSHVSAMLAAIAAHLGIEIQTRVKPAQSTYHTFMQLRETAAARRHGAVSTL